MAHILLLQDITCEISVKKQINDNFYSCSFQLQPAKEEKNLLVCPYYLFHTKSFLKNVIKVGKSRTPNLGFN